MHTAEPLVPGPSRLEIEIAVAKLKKCKSPGSDQIPEELIQDVCLQSTNCLISGRNLLLFQFTGRGIILTALIVLRYYSY
jgi:hypothetical protein